MKNKKNQGQTYDFICFSDLAYEFDVGERKKIESKIRKRLKYHGLGKFDPDRVEIIRKLKDQLREEFRDYKSSKHYRGGTGPYCDPKDFDFESFLQEYRSRFPEIALAEMEDILHFAIYLYYLR
ncbi:hypothetical protein [Leptospira adleri]|uniref:Uncharacterized protein n=1 Tax=Leptospira adleri TaxID=2023186 RepID=A0A2M9YKM5_9LEPT|nr:hypothetical protein [Leptospira adleri]PJZ52106.1 hypothetical protein CH380_16860 [Leptospira adleri]PJZ62968.1 hypothetical protein CH376_05640 [Leptospira adleri]TGM58509.1 hypothetical protein EHQ97_05270 [Leptospira adleri]